MTTSPQTQTVGQIALNTISASSPQTPSQAQQSTTSMTSGLGSSPATPQTPTSQISMEIDVSEANYLHNIFYAVY